MTKPVRGVIMLALVFVSLSSNSQQQKEPKFGEVKPSDFAPTAYSIDSTANAVILFDYGSSYYEGDTKGGFSVIFKRHKKIRILNKNAFDVADIKLSLYADGMMEEKIDELQACTYTLENGKVETFKLDKSSIFKDKLDKNHNVRKFTLPDIKEGCIIEVKYSLNSPYERYINPWQFQGDYPVLWSQYDVEIPNIYSYVVSNHGYLDYTVNDGSTGYENYNILVPGESMASRSEMINFKSPTIIHKWAIKNVPAIKEEDFTTSMSNHVSRVEFQLSKISFPNSPEKNVMQDWYSTSEDLLKNEDFGEQLDKNIGGLQSDLKKIVSGLTDRNDKAKKIFEYIRDYMSCTGQDTKWLSQSLKKSYQNKSGNVADINLLLTASLISQGFTASPVLVSTRENGYANKFYPILSDFNYVIAQVIIDDKPYLLDASNSKLGFGKLTKQSYNGVARVINKTLPAMIVLSADSVMEYKVTNAFFINDTKNNGISGEITHNLGQFESQKIREKLVKTSEDDFFKEIKKEYNGDVEITGMSIENLKNLEQPVVVKYTVNIDTKEDLIYLNPILSEAYKENPFKAAERHYPVEMPATMNENFILRMEIPSGYTVEELPKSSRVNLNENEGVFEYLVSKEENIIQLRSTIKLKKAIFATEDYETLRSFFGYIVKKHSEQIVLKKIK